MEGFISFLGIFVFLIFILVFIVTPIVMVFNLKLSLGSKIATSFFSFTSLVLICLEFAGLDLGVIGLSSVVLGIVSYIIILINMVILGHFKDRKQNISPVINLFLYIFEFFILLFPILDVKSGSTGKHNIFGLLNNYEITPLAGILLASVIVGAIVNILLRDIRKTICLDIICQFAFLLISIQFVGLASSNYTAIDGTLTLFLMVFLSIFGTSFVACQAGCISDYGPTGAFTVNANVKTHILSIKKRLINR